MIKTYNSAPKCPEILRQFAKKTAQDAMLTLLRGRILSQSNAD